MITEFIMLKKLYPGVNKIWLQLAAGLMWSGVGIMLISIAATRWLKLFPWGELALVILAGGILGSGIYWFGFSRMARENIRRIEAYVKERVCLFAFQKWSSYPLVAFMVGLGIYLRLYSPFPKPLLSIVYIGIGVGLFASSIHYYGQVARMARPEAVKEESGAQP
jgi:hypothetical protein